MLFSVNVHMPKDRITQAHQGYGFVEFIGEEDADYAIKIMNMIKLFGKPIRVNKVRGLICALPIFLNLHILLWPFWYYGIYIITVREILAENIAICVHLF